MLWVSERVENTQRIIEDWFLLSVCGLCTWCKTWIFERRNELLKIKHAFCFVMCFYFWENLSKKKNRKKEKFFFSLIWKIFVTDVCWCPYAKRFIERDLMSLGVLIQPKRRSLREEGGGRGWVLEYCERLSGIKWNREEKKNIFFLWQNHCKDDALRFWIPESKREIFF
jgi:hypothetical protein